MRSTGTRIAKFWSGMSYNASIFHCAIMSNIHLTLSSTKPWDATYRTPEGQVIYKVESTTPLLEARTIKISKIMPAFLDNRMATESREAEYLRDSFAHLATVEYHRILSSRIGMGDLDIATSDYFRREGWSLPNLGRLVIFNCGAPIPLSHNV